MRAARREAGASHGVYRIWPRRHHAPAPGSRGAPLCPAGRTAAFVTLGAARRPLPGPCSERRGTARGPRAREPIDEQFDAQADRGRDRDRIGIGGGLGLVLAMLIQADVPLGLVFGAGIGVLVGLLVETLSVGRRD